MRKDFWDVNISMGVQKYFQFLIAAIKAKLITISFDIVQTEIIS